MKREPLLILGAVTAALEAAQVVFVTNKTVSGVIGAVIAGVTFYIGRSQVTPRQDGLP